LEIDRELGYTEGEIYGLIGIAAVLPPPDAALLLGAERFAVAHAAGAALSHDDAVERALAL
jgi:hypothetical protein